VTGRLVGDVGFDSGGDEGESVAALLPTLPDDEIAVFQDEVDIHLNPDIGSMWMRRGHQATVETPGNNQTRYLAGSLNGRTGRLIHAFGPRHNSALFPAHPRDVKRALRRYRVIHGICHNASFHDSKAVRAYLAECRGQIVVHFLPSCSPDLNPIERIGWHLREEITRNHRCHTMEELIDLVMAWIENKKRFAVERSVYTKKTSKKNHKRPLSLGRGAV